MACEPGYVFNNFSLQCESKLNFTNNLSRLAHKYSIIYGYMIFVPRKDCCQHYSSVLTVFAKMIYDHYSPSDK